MSSVMRSPHLHADLVLQLREQVYCCWDNKVAAHYLCPSASYIYIYIYNVRLHCSSNKPQCPSLHGCLCASLSMHISWSPLFFFFQSTSTSPPPPSPPLPSSSSSSSSSSHPLLLHPTRSRRERPGCGMEERISCPH